MLKCNCIVVFCLACSTNEPVALENTPHAAFERLQQANRGGNAESVYDHLDLESQWSVQSIYRAEREMARLAQAFPEPARSREASRYGAAAQAADARAFFRSLHFDAELKAAKAANMHQGPDGRWGFAGLRDLLKRKSEHTDQALSLMQRSAEEYRR